MTSNPRNPVPDLLKRFVPTPYKLIAKGAMLETNDIDLLEQFEISSRSHQLAELAPNFQIRVIRELSDAADTSEARTLCEGTVCILTIGGGTIIMVDREQRRVFAFLAPNVSNQKFARVYLPMAMNHGDAPSAPNLRQVNHAKDAQIF